MAARAIALAGPLRARSRRASGSGALTIAASAGALAMTLGTGVLLARVLDPAGRGEVAAILTAPQMIGWVFLLGSTQTISYFRAREPESAGALLGTWLVLTIPLSAAAVVLGELLLPSIMAAQTDAALALAQLFMLTAGLVLLTESVLGFVLGAEHFLLFNALKVLVPALVAASYVGAWLAGELTVAWAVWSFAAVNLLVVAGVVAFLVRRHGLARPRLDLARRTLWYGAKAHSTNVSFLLNARLDLLILPAFVPAATVGLYSVATNVSWIVFALAGSVAAIVLPVAARQGATLGPATVARSVRATLFVALGLAAGLALVAGPLVHLVFGASFDASVGALRILLPGSVLYAVALVLVSGLYAANRPFTAACVQGTGLVVTVAGLLLFLRPGGIEAAAWVSTAAYATVFAGALLAYRRASGLPWRAFAVPPRAQP
jgi:O-antigen/teichoic acid export membrane protein